MSAAVEPRPPRPRDVVGAPVLPPVAATRALNATRGRLGRLRRALAPPPVQILESALAGLEPAVLAALCHLDVPDRLAAGPVGLDALADELGVDPQRLQRLVRYAHVHGWLRLDRRGQVRATRVTRFLQRDHPGGWRAWVVLTGGPEIGAAISALAAALTADHDPFEAANGEPFFAWMLAHPPRHATFDAAMAAGARLHGLLLARALPWSSSRRVCDIGGGDGTLLDVLVGHHPHLRGVVLELPEVVARMPPRARISAEVGDAFRAVPGGCDTYLLVNVLHDWSDREATVLLRRAGEAAAAGSGDEPPARVVIVDSEVRSRPGDDVSLRADLLMLALTPGGRERTEHELVALGRAAGLHPQRIHRLGTGDLAIVLQPEPPSRALGSTWRPDDGPR